MTVFISLGAVMAKHNIIIGAGPVGLILALHLHSLGINTLLVGPKPKVLPGMVFALHPHNIKFLTSLGLQPPSAIVQKMQLQYNHQHLVFDTNHTNRGSLCHIIKQKDLINALSQACARRGVNWLKSLPKELSESTITIDNKSYFFERIFACDGCHSWTRSHTNIKAKYHDYKQFSHTAILSHPYKQKHAFQDFINNNTLALLPLPNPHQSALIWSCNIEKHHNILDKGLGPMLKAHCGALSKIEHHQYIPLKSIFAENYYQDNMFLVGNALHNIHPLAGVGLNLAIGDIITLGEMVITHKDGSFYQNNRVAAHTKAHWLTHTIATMQFKIPNSEYAKLFLSLKETKDLLFTQIDRICLTKYY